MRYTDELHIDVETFSSVNIKTAGHYKYVESPDFEIMLFSYAWNDEPVRTVDYKQPLPRSVKEALTDPRVLKIAHNAAFEILTIETHYGLVLDSSQWFCTQIGAAYMGLPLKLEKVAEVLNLSEQKDRRGQGLITYFAGPCKATKTNGGRTRNLPHHNPEKWDDYKYYNRQDVRTEQEILKYLRRFDPIPEAELAYWDLDQEINRRGVCVDLELVNGVIAENDAYVNEVLAETARIIKTDKPNSLDVVKAYLERKTGRKFDSLAKGTLEDLLKDKSIRGDARRVLELREQSSKTSNSKYKAMLNYLCDDGRIRGLFQFYGANRTGRWAGRGVQLQNLKRTIKKYIETARNAFKNGLASLLYNDISDLSSKLVRTALVAAAGNMLVSCDFAAIESRVLAWIAGEDWKIDAFESHGKIYELTYSKMFNVPFESIGNPSKERDIGKVADLASGFGGGFGAYVKMGALKMGIPEDDIEPLKKAWRREHPMTVRMWKKVENAAKYVIKNRCAFSLHLPGATLEFSYEKGYMFIKLPSGRKLAYYGAGLEYNGSIYYYGMSQEPGKPKIWRKISTYGGSLVENIIQAIARDCLTPAMWRMRHLPLIMHIHDEIVAEVPEDRAEEFLAEMKRLMSIRPRWAPDLPLGAAGYISKFYKKD